MDLLSLELLTIDVQQEQDVYTSKGVPVRVDGVAQIKVKGDDISIATAAEQFLSKDTEDIKNIAMQTLEGHLRAILGTMTVEDIYQNRDAFASKVQEVAAGDMANMGLGIVSFTIRDIRDSQGYLDALGKPRIAQVKRDAQIAQAEADRDAMIKSSQAMQAGQEAKFAADYQDRRGPAGLPIQRRAIPGGGEPEEGRGRPGLRFAEVQDRPAREGRGGAGQHHREAEADRAAAAGNHAQAARTGSQRAEARRRRALQGRDAGQRPQVPVGDRGRRARRRRPRRPALPTRTWPRPPVSPKPRRTRRAVWPRPSVIEAQGKATAEAMRVKAESFKQYNEAAVVEMIIRVLPEVAGKISEPLSKMEKMVIINSGNGVGGGASKLTGDVTQIMAQLPPVIESLTGIKFEKLLEQVPGLKKAMESSTELPRKTTTTVLPP